MRKVSLIALLALCGAVPSFGRTNLDVRGVNYTVDTLYHAKIGPGTTQTQLRLEAGNMPLDVFYLTVDRTTPGVSIRTVNSTDKVAGNERTSAMAQRKTVDGLHYFAGTNGDFYATAGTATNGTSVVGTPVGSTTVDSEVYTMTNTQYQFAIEPSGATHIGSFNYYTGTASIGDKTTLFKGVNVSSPANGITLYTPRYWGSANQGDFAGACHQVSARLAEGSEPFVAGGKFSLVVTSEPETHGDMTIPDDGFIIHGRGTSAESANTTADDFVAALRPGDVVTFDNVILNHLNQPIHPSAIISGFPKNMQEGTVIDFTDTSRHPRTGIGVSSDGTKIILMVVDGRSSSSVGVTFSELGDIMQFAGAYEALNLDGGGSSTLYTEAFGVRNHTSDGSERAVGNGIFAVLEAPEDDAIAEIAFKDWAMTMPHYGLYTPVIYGYNKYGRLVDTDVKGFTLSSDAGTADGPTLTATAIGTYALTATYNGATASIPVTVAEVSDVTPKYASVVLDSTREWPVDLVAAMGTNKLAVSPVPFDWTTSDASIATVDEDGTVRGVADGTAVITGTFGENTCSVKVDVQIPVETAMAIERTGEVDAWSITGTSISKGFTVSALDNGLAVDFTLSSTRGPLLKAQLNREVYSLPEALRIRVNPGDTRVTKVITIIKANNETRTVQLTHDAELPLHRETALTYNLADIFDTAGDLGVYPITFQSVSFYLSGATKTPYRLEVPGIEGVYDEKTLGVDDITLSDGDDASAAPAQWYNLQGIPVDAPTAPGLYIAPGQKVLVK